MKDRQADCIVIGGGASGVMAAWSFRRHHPDGQVILLEKETKLLRKVAASGNGRCNLSNQAAGLKHYATRESPFPQFQKIVRTTLNHFGFAQTVKFFEQIGLPIRLDSEGRCYPYCEQSSAVTAMCEAALQHAGVRVLLGAEAVELLPADVPGFPERKWRLKVIPSVTAGGKRQSDRQPFDLLTEPLQLTCSAVILAAGSQAAAALGGSESGYRLLRELDQPITELRPALVPLVLPDREQDWLETIAGERFRGRVKLIGEGKCRAETSGEFLFTKDGLSGIAAMELARELVPGQPAMLEIDFVPERTKAELESYLQAKRRQYPQMPDGGLAAGILRLKLAEGISRRGRQPLVEKLKQLRLEVVGSRGFEQAQIVSGGLNLKAVNPLTLSLKAHPDLYVCGEILDVDGQTGGYNLQWAWSSGYLAGSLQP